MELKGKGGSQETRGKESIEGEVEKEVGFETPPNENKEKRGEKSQEEPKKEKKKKKKKKKKEEEGKLVIQGLHMVSSTRCPAWSDQVK